MEHNRRQAMGTAENIMLNVKTITNPDEILGRLTTPAAKEAFNKINALKPSWVAYEFNRQALILPNIQVVMDKTLLPAPSKVPPVSLFESWNDAMTHVANHILSAAEGANTVVVSNSMPAIRGGQNLATRQRTVFKDNQFKPYEPTFYW
jgi:hypothetical protein